MVPHRSRDRKDSCEVAGVVSDGLKLTRQGLEKLNDFFGLDGGA
jgi:hypothetical protein